MPGGGTLLQAAVKTRPVFWHLSVGLKIAWYALAVVSVLVFLYGVARPFYKWSRGRGGPWPPYPWRELPARLWRGLQSLLSHRTIARRDRLAGWAHRGIFYGWIVLFAGTVVLGFNTDFTKPVFGLDYFHGNFYLGYKEVLNVLGTVLIAGVLVMMFRRGVLRPRKLDYTRPDRAPGEVHLERRTYRVGDWAFISILLVIALTGFVLEGVRIAMSHPGYGGTQFGGWVVAQALSGVSSATLGGVRHGLWWFHGLLAIAFVASIPYTKAGHMITSYLSLSLRDPLAGKRLAVIPPERASAPAGYGQLQDFSPLHLLQIDACTKCGRCHEACPANATGRPLSPRDVVLELHEQSNVAIGGVLGGLMAGRLDGGGAQDDAVVGQDGVRTETVWSCMQCNACVEACPVGIEQAPIINQLRRRLVEEGELDPNVQSVLQTIHKSGNSFGERNRRRGRWTEELDFDVKDARREPVEVLWFVGDYASFDPRSQRVSRTLARLLDRAGVEFGILYDGERNSGNDVRRVGEEGLFEDLAEHNIAAISECEFQRIMTSDPHSLNTLRNEYPVLGADWQVLHHAELLLELILAGRLDVGGRLSYRTTYHDPCYLGRHNGVYEAPRQILRELGCTLLEMPRNRSNSFCCGAGGGRIWIPDEPGQERPAENRIREAVALQAVELFVVSCPKDVTMFEDAIKTSGNAERIELRELTELVEEALLPAEVAATT
ncbi:MAG: (Fe-S)-binding protein [Solirubrobacterales bacterium]|nr:(Fe-S)-binding protein [Solirubrobacterales bacterium]MBV9534519.1 (Fe-S)-binding protein [Solirubrobacterales bacterium]